jgi:glycogen debranching enzyme
MSSGRCAGWRGCSDLEGEGHSADELRSRANATEAALERLWLEDAGGYAIGLDGSKRPGFGLTSNQGHLLWAGTVSAERAERVCGMLMSDAMFSGWGIRTLGKGNPTFNPVGYHAGTVWPHDNALIAQGLRPDGLNRRLRIIRPSFPHWLGRVEVSWLRRAGATIDLCFERTGQHVTLADARIDGDVEVGLEIAGDRRTFEDV